LFITKLKIMKKIIKKYILPLLIIGVISLSSCIKERNDGATDFSNVNLAPFVQIYEGGLSQFSSQALLFPAANVSDTAYFRLNYAAKNAAPNDIVVTLAYDDNALVTYNSANPSPTPYLKMPDSISSFATTKVTIKAGQSYSDPIPFVVYPNKVDPSVSYMFPISIKDASGNAISGNLGTIYYHLIGNPLAGSYTTTGKRYNYNNGAVIWNGPPDPFPGGYIDGTTSAYNSTVVAAPVNSQTVKLVMGNVPDPQPVGGAAYYYITGNVGFTSITYTNGDNFNAGYSNIQQYIISYIPPSPTQKPSFHLITKYNNTTGGAGNDRIIDQTFVHK
jgi:Domain of unknown function (DUF1735)